MADQVPDGTGDSLKLGHRVSVVGATGSGKTTTGKRLANILGVPFVELDALQWEANWTVAQDDIFRERIESAISGDRWVVDGNYSRIQPIVWRRADTVIWIDYSLQTIFRQLLRRTLRRLITQEELWAGNTEGWRIAFASRESLFVWLFKTYWRRRKRYAKAAAGRENSHIEFVRLTSPIRTGEWLAAVQRKSCESTSNPPGTTARRSYP